MVNGSLAMATGRLVVLSSLLFAATALAACSTNVRAADGGAVPLDSARAVAIARRAACGAPGSATDAACTLRGYSVADGKPVVTIDRRPPAGNDRVAITLANGGNRVSMTQVTGAGLKQ